MSLCLCSSVQGLHCYVSSANHEKLNQEVNVSVPTSPVPTSPCTQLSLKIWGHFCKKVWKGYATLLCKDYSPCETVTPLSHQGDPSLNIMWQKQEDFPLKWYSTFRALQILLCFICQNCCSNRLISSPSPGACGEKRREGKGEVLALGTGFCKVYMKHLTATPFYKTLPFFPSNSGKKRSRLLLAGSWRKGCLLLASSHVNLQNSKYFTFKQEK